MGFVFKGKEFSLFSGDTFVIAEAGINHNGDMEIARQLVWKAAEIGVDAVKFQSFTADKLVNKMKDEGMWKFFKTVELDRKAHVELQRECASAGIEFLSTPFDAEGADLLEELGVGGFKIASCDLTNTPFLRHVAAKGLPIILSTGMSSLDEVRHALETIRPLNKNVVVLHCTSLYPTLPEEANLYAMKEMRRELGVEVGYSDHTEGIAVPLAAVAMGAVCLEKHFTLDRGMEGPDQQISCDPAGFSELVKGVRQIEQARGSEVKRPTRREVEQTRDAFRKSIFVTRKVFPGQVLTAADITVARPALGISPTDWDSVVGKTVKAEIEAGNPLKWSDVA